MPICFAVSGSAGAEYLVEFVQDGTAVRATCTCPAGQQRQACKHRLALMDGQGAAILSGNASDLPRLQSLLAGSETLAAYQRVAEATAAHEATKRALESARKALSRIMHEGG